MGLNNKALKGLTNRIVLLGKLNIFLGVVLGYFLSLQTLKAR